MKHIPGNITAVARSMEKYISFNFHLKEDEMRIVFLDSYLFLSTSLGKLAEKLDDDVKSIIRDMYGENYHLLMKKLYFHMKN